MPKVDGLALCKLIREAAFSHYIYIILLTGMSGKQNLISGIDAGADDFATKPAELEELEVRLRSAKRVLELEASLAQKNQSLEEANQLIQKDLENAAETQLSVLPEPLTEGRLHTSWLYRPAVFVGGDTFNYFKVAPDLYAFFSLDISGHGVSSAMMSMSLQSTLVQTRGLYGGSISREQAGEIPQIFACNLNKMMLANKSEHYLTMIFGIVDFKHSTLHYVQAGHPHPFFYEKNNNQLKTFEVNGFPIGLFDGAEYETQHVPFEAGDRFILYSDGISENESALNNELLETVNLHRHFEQIKNQPMHEMLNVVSTKWLANTEMNKLPDDISVLVFEFN
jgi:sigma-B regulation protein RsbU (phosphoserine phosphatase)